ncbi:MAG: serine/threonine-protein kinase, partial [Blastocatellia bacterium]
MTSEQWQQVRALYEAACTQADEPSSAWLRAQCADPFVRATVTQMLADRPHLDGFLEPPVLPVPRGNDDALQAATGRRIGAYVLERELGRGGMGVVYLAARADAAFQKQVAIKLLWPGLPEDQKRFQRERQILADLDHPGIARLLDGNVTPEGWPYIVMEYVAGLPITAYCDQHWMDCTARIQLLLKVCDAVEYAHAHRVIHRDLKPANLLVTPDGTPRLLDFGIAKLLDAELLDGLGLSTQTGMRAMTPDYASPEQMRGAAITPASDVYSLGVLLYELLTGQRPFSL